MASVGTAYVSIRVDTKGFEKSLDSMLARLSAKMDTAGAKLGKDFTNGLKGTDWNAGFSGLSTAASKASKDAVKSLDQVENKIISVANYSSDAGDVMEDSFDRVGRAARDAKGDVGDLSKELTSAKNASRGINFGGAGGGSGALRTAGDSAGYFSSKLQELASYGPRSTAIMSGLFNTAAFGGTALAGLVGGASAAAQGIFAIGANAAAAVPAVSVLTTGMIGLAQVGAAVGLSMAGVGNAIGLGMKSVTAVNPATTAAASGTKKLGDQLQKMVKPAKVSRDAIQSAKEAVQDSVRGIVDAKEDLQRAYRDAGWAATDSARRTKRAEAELATAQIASKDAQDALNEARALAIEQLEDIGFKAEDAALAEERAELSLEEAYAKLLEVSQLAPDDRARREAELAYKEAELGLRTARDAREDADAEAAAAAESGIEGTEAMMSAREDLASAKADEAQATVDLAEAEREEARTAVENAESIADAEQRVVDARNAHREALAGVSDAQADYAQAVKEANAAAAEANARAREANAQLGVQAPALTAVQKAVDAYQQALQDLSPSQREFVERLVGLRGAFIAARQDIAEPLFEGLNTALTTLINGDFLGIVKRGLEGTSEVLGQLAIDAAAAVEEGPFKESFGRVMESNNESLKNFGGAGINLADSFVQIADAASPLLEDLSEWALRVTEGWKQTIRAKNENGSLRDSFQDAANRVREFWNLAKELWRTLDILGESANKAANNFGDLGRKGEENKDKFGYITSLTDSLKKFNDDLDKTPGKVAGFTQTLETLNAVGRTFKNVVIDPITSLGQDPNIEKAFNQLGDEQTAKAMDRIAGSAGKAVPLLADVADNVIEIIATMSESGAIEHFLEIMKDITGALKNVVEWLGKTSVGDKSLLQLTAYITGALAAWRLLKKGLVLTTSPFAALIDGVLDYTKKVRAARGAGKGLFKSLGAGFKGGPVGGAAGGAGGVDSDAGIITAMETNTAEIVRAINLCCTKMTAAMGRGAAASGAGALAAAPRGAAAAGAAGGIGGAAAGAGKVGKLAGIFGAVSKAAGPLGFVLKGVGVAFRFMLGPVGLILSLLPLLWPLFELIEKKTGIFSKTLDLLKKVLADAGEEFKWLWDKMKELWNWVSNNWGVIFDVLTKPIQDAVGVVTTAWESIKTAVSDAVTWVKDKLKGIWDGITAGWDKIETFFSELWSVHIKPWIDDLIDQAGALLTGLWDGIKAGWWKLVGWSDILENWVATKVQNLVDKAKDVLKNIWEIIKDKWDALKTWAGGLWDSVSGKFTSFINSVGGVLKNIWDKITEKWGDIKDWLDGLWDSVSGKFANFIDSAHTKLGTIWNGVKNTWDEFKTWVGGLWNGPHGVSTKVGEFVDSFQDKIGNIWNAIENGFKTGYNAMVPKVNTYLIGGLNKILKFVGAGTIDGMSTYAEGGPVRGPGGPKSDRVFARLSNGEYVMPTKAARAIGQPALDYMRKHGTLPSTGGLFGWAKDKWDDVKDAIASGAEDAFKYVISQAEGLLGTQTLVGRLTVGAINKASSLFTAIGKKDDAQKAAAAAAAAGPGAPYTGPPGGWTYPVSRWVPISQWPNSGHSPPNSIDFDGATGDSIRAASRGIVAYTKSMTTSYGNHVVVNHANGISTLYAHLASINVRAGQKVSTGQMLGMMGTTGNSTGVHLHFEVQGNGMTDEWLRSHGVRLARGGVVAPSQNGTMALLAEAGKSERVTPLDPEGFTPSERKMIQLLENRLGGGGGGDTYHIHPSQQVDEVGLADLVARRVSWNRRRGAGTR